MRRRTPRGESVAGRRFVTTVGPVAHGGHCVARVSPDPDRPEETRVVFVRHCLPGEQVVVEITEGTEGDRFWRGDAVEVLQPAPDRVEAPCRYAGPGGCGGCDFQHVSLPGQRALKTAVLREQLVRLGGLPPDDPRVVGVEVEAVPVPHRDRDHGLHWRTRMQYVDLPGGGRGMRKHRSHEVIAIEECLIEAPAAAAVASHRVHGRDFAVAGGGFWQVHPAAATVLVDTVLDLLDPRPGERVLDLYAGVGLFGAFLAEAVGETGRVDLVEADAVASALSADNVPGPARIGVHHGPVHAVLDRLDCPPADLVVLDPPREGARRAVVEQVVSCAPRAVAYVACDPAALGRDLATFAEHGYRLAGLRAFDLFPMTHHLEAVALLTR